LKPSPVIRALSLLLIWLALLVAAPPRTRVAHAVGDRFVASAGAGQGAFPGEGLVDLSELDEVEVGEDLEVEEEDAEAPGSAAHTRRRWALGTRVDHRPRDGQLLRTLRMARGPPTCA
jgi:hypothetical protein